MPGMSGARPTSRSLPIDVFSCGWRLPPVALLLGCAIQILMLAGCGDVPRSRDFSRENLVRWQATINAAGGNFEAWKEKVRPYHADISGLLNSRPCQIAGIPGRNGYIFFRRSLEVLLAGDLRLQENGRDPFPAIVNFQRQLKTRGISLLFCAIPVKGAVMCEHLSDNAPGPNQPSVNPYTVKLLKELTEAGVECIDLMPAFTSTARSQGEEPLYMPLDTHWSNLGVRVAARVFAERIRQFPWYERARGKGVNYSTRPATCRRRGDIVPMLGSRERMKYRPMELAAQQVVDEEGLFYSDTKTSPIIFLGDSYSSVFHKQDCKHAGITAHIAREIGIPLQLELSLGGGPEVRKKLARRGRDALVGKRLVIWALSERDLFNYRSPWDIVLMP